jgi:uncharacterized protein YbcI
MTRKTKGQVEAEISQAVVKFELEYMGRGPSDVRTHLLQDMIVVRLQGILTPAERQLVKVDGVELIKQVRAKLLETGKSGLKQSMEEITGLSAVSMHADLSTTTGERVILFVMADNVEEKFGGLRR